MFIVKKTISGKEYYYLRKSERKNGKVRAVTVAYLGKTREEAESKRKAVEKELKEEKFSEEVKKQKVENKKVESVTMDKINNLDKEEFVRKKISIEDLAVFCKEKGFVFRSSDIYGGLSGFWDFGPLGVELFKNIKDDWWNNFVRKREDVVGIDASIISHPRVWEASGHLDSFQDVAVVCKKCGNSTKLDVSEVGKVKCDKCGGDYESKGKFNLLFKTQVGALDSRDSYLRGETAQNMFLDFRLVAQTSRMKLPFGIAQVGKCFRNEIAPRDFLFRSREFHIAEFEYFINPEENKCKLLSENLKNVSFKFWSAENQVKNIDELEEVKIKDLLSKDKLDEWHAYWLGKQINWFRNLGLEKIKIREHMKDELSHYSSATFDVDYEYPFGSKEVAGIANRGQFDLTQHEKFSKENLSIFDEVYGKSVIPRVIEPTFGMERIFLAVLSKAYNYDKEKDYVVLKLPAKIAPVKAAIFPIVKKPEIEELSREIYEDLIEEFNVVYDKSGSIGRRYARNDGIGTPYCITIDGESLDNKDVTLRERDTGIQKRVLTKDLRNVLKDLILGKIRFEDLK